MPQQQPQFKKGLPPALAVTPNPTPFIWKTTAGSDVPDDLLEKCAKLFSEHYGVWSEEASKVSSFLKPGQHVKLNAKKLRAQSLSPPQSSVLVTCFEADDLVGHAFATVWAYEGGKVGWVTQLVVHPSYRRRYIATHLLQHLKLSALFQDITAVGLASSHPASVAALAKYNDVDANVNSIALPFIATTAPKVIASTPINYLKGAKLLGSLFSSPPSSSSSPPSSEVVQEEPHPNAVSSIDTQFYVDHQEPLEVLKSFKEREGGGWVLGELEEGKEFLVVVPVIVQPE